MQSFDNRKGKIPLGQHERKCQDNIKMDCKEIGRCIPVLGTCDHSNELQVPKKMEFVDQQSNCKLFKQDSAPWS
jgi:hypothetical protein